MRIEETEITVFRGRGLKVVWSLFSLIVVSYFSWDGVF